MNLCLSTENFCPWRYKQCCSDCPKVKNCSFVCSKLKDKNCKYSQAVIRAEKAVKCSPVMLAQYVEELKWMLPERAETKVVMRINGEDVYIPGLPFYDEEIGCIVLANSEDE